MDLKTFAEFSDDGSRMPQRTRKEGETMPKKALLIPRGLLATPLPDPHRFAVAFSRSCVWGRSYRVYGSFLIGHWFWYDVCTKLNFSIVSEGPSIQYSSHNRCTRKRTALKTEAWRFFGKRPLQMCFQATSSCVLSGCVIIPWQVIARSSVPPWSFH